METQTVERVIASLKQGHIGDMFLEVSITTGNSPQPTKELHIVVRVEYEHGCYVATADGYPSLSASAGNMKDAFRRLCITVLEMLVRFNVNTFTTIKCIRITRKS